MQFRDSAEKLSEYIAQLTHETSGHRLAAIDVFRLAMKGAEDATDREACARAIDLLLPDEPRRFEERSGVMTEVGS